MRRLGGWLVCFSLAACTSSEGAGGGGQGDSGAADSSADSSIAPDGPGTDSRSDAPGPGNDSGLTDVASDASLDGSGSRDGAPDDAATSGDASVIDPTFGDAGVLVGQSPLPDGAPFLDRIDSIAVRPDGRIVLGMSVAWRGFAVGQLLADGSAFDPTFGTSGIALLPGWDNLNDGNYYGGAMVGLTSSGGIVVAYGSPVGNVTALLQDTSISLLTANGALDPTFGNGGTVSYTTQTYQMAITGLVVDSSDQTWFTGDWYNINGNRFNAFSGGLDSTGNYAFQGWEIIGLASAGGGTDCPGVAAQSGGGRYLQLCTTGTTVTLAGISQTSGLTDTTFGSNGSVDLGPGTAQALEVRPDDTIVAVTQIPIGTGLGLQAVRLTASGMKVAAFGDAGTLTVGAPGSLSSQGVVPLGGADYAAGTLTSPDGGSSQLAVIKLVGSGLGTTYGIGGLGLLPIAGNPTATAVGAQDAGILVGAYRPSGGVLLARARP